MDRNVLLHTVGSARFLALIKGIQTNELRNAQQNYLLCKSLLVKRRNELVDANRQNLDTSALRRTISRLEASQKANLSAVQELEARDNS